MIKLQASLPAGSRRHADFARERILVDARGWRDPAESAACLPILLDALWRGRQVRFVYHRVLGEPGERTADPLGLVAKGSTWYLIACAESEPRTYRVSRMRDAQILDQPAAPLAGFDLAAYWERSAAEFREKLPRYHATFVAASEVMKWVRYRAWRLEEETAAGESVRIRLRFDAEEEAIQFALSFGGRIEVIEPAELRAKVLDAAQAIVGRYL
jgi:predicted DNA-binding transcriptional regulator YafY